MVGLIMFCPSAALRKWSYNTTGYLISFIKNDIAHWDVFWPFVCHWYHLRFLNIILFCHWEEFKAALIPSLYQAERDTSSHVWIFCHVPSEGRKGSCYLMVFLKHFLVVHQKRKASAKGKPRAKGGAWLAPSARLRRFTSRKWADSISLLFVAMLAVICGCGRSLRHLKSSRRWKMMEGDI